MDLLTGILIILFGGFTLLFYLLSAGFASDVLNTSAKRGLGTFILCVHTAFVVAAVIHFYSNPSREMNQQCGEELRLQLAKVCSSNNWHY